MMQEGNIGPISREERLERLGRIVSARTLSGWNVVDRDERGVYAVLVLPEKPINHRLHAGLTILTCGVWGILWAVVAATHRKEQRVRVSIDPSGNLLEEQITVG